MLGSAYRSSGVNVARLTAAEDARLCAVLDLIVGLAFQGFAPPLGASPEEAAAAANVNAHLAQVREQVRAFTTKEGMDC